MHNINKISKKQKKQKKTFFFSFLNMEIKEKKNYLYVT